MQQRGVLALPKHTRTRYGLDRPGAQVEVVERDDGVIELHPHVPIPAEQAWFWTERWQEREREVDEQLRRGESRRFDSDEEFLAFLDAVEPDADE